MCSWVLSFISEIPGAPLKVVPRVGSGSLPARHNSRWVLVKQKVQLESVVSPMLFKNVLGSRSSAVSAAGFFVTVMCLFVPEFPVLFLSSLAMK